MQTAEGDREHGSGLARPPARLDPVRGNCVGEEVHAVADRDGELDRRDLTRADHLGPEDNVDGVGGANTPGLDASARPHSAVQVDLEQPAAVPERGGSVHGGPDKRSGQPMIPRAVNGGRSRSSALNLPAKYQSGTQH